jgi:outer membrane lipoprotein-sorting protein
MASLAAVAWFVSGCAASHTTAVKPGQAPAPVQAATREQLIERYNRQAQSIQTINAGVAMKLTSGSAYSGVIEQYHEVNGFILAAKPSSIRVIGQAPVIGKNIFDMVSDGKTFEISIPSKHKFVTGPVNLQRQSAKPIENLRPQHLSDALLWAPIPPQSIVVFEESAEPNLRYYVLTVLRSPTGTSVSRGSDTASADFEIAEKIWFDRSDLHISRVEGFGTGGVLSSDVRYADWQPAGGQSYPRQIEIARASEDYQLGIHINKLTLNGTLAADAFALKPPPGSDLVRVGEDGTEKTEPAAKEPAVVQP